MQETEELSNRAATADEEKTADLSTTLRSGRDDKSIAQNKFVISTGA